MIDEHDLFRLCKDLMLFFTGFINQFMPPSFYFLGLIVQYLYAKIWKIIWWPQDC